MRTVRGEIDNASAISDSDIPAATQDMTCFCRDVNERMSLAGRRESGCKLSLLPSWQRRRASRSILEAIAHATQVNGDEAGLCRA